MSHEFYRRHQQHNPGGHAAKSQAHKFGGQIRAASDAFDQADEEGIAQPQESLARRLDELHVIRQEAHDAVLDHAPTTLADVAVLAGHALAMLDHAASDRLDKQVSNGSMQNTLDTICRALAGILAVTSEASGVPVEDIGWRDLPRTMANRLTPGYPSQTFAVDTRLAAITAAGLGMWAWVEAGAACMNISAALVAQRRGNPTAKPAPADLRTVLDTFRNLWAEV